MEPMVMHRTLCVDGPLAGQLVYTQYGAQTYAHELDADEAAAAGGMQGQAVTYHVHMAACFGRMAYWATVTNVEETGLPLSPLFDWFVSDAAKGATD